MAEQTATIKSRAEILTLPVFVGMSVASARAKFRSVLNIPSNANPTVDGRAVEEGYTIKANDTVNFTVALGEKGV